MIREARWITQLRFEQCSCYCVAHRQGLGMHCLDNENFQTIFIGNLL